MVMWATIKVAWLEGESYWTEENVCWNTNREKACQPGNLACEQEAALKCAAGIFEVQLGT